jgi:hypothetical protein
MKRKELVRQLLREGVPCEGFVTPRRVNLARGNKALARVPIGKYLRLK